jgi:transcriptional regulator with XRE-family HTH domain
MSALGVLLRRHREGAGLTEEELADRAGVSARTVSDIERGVRSRAYADTADRLSVALALTDVDRSTFVEAARGRKPAGGIAPVPSGVPRPLTPLLGREQELGDVLGALGTGGSRLLTTLGLAELGRPGSHWPQPPSLSGISMAGCTWSGSPRTRTRAC